MKSTLAGQSLKHGGYTIIETMIFLMISAVLVLGAVGLFNGRIQRAQFTQAAQSFDTALKTTANQAATGTYPESPFNCTVNASGALSINVNGTGAQGSRPDCIFVGKILAPAASCAPLGTNIQTISCEAIDVYTVVGRRLLTTGQVSGSLTGATDSANPKIATKLTQTIKLGYGTHITGVYQAGTPPTLNSGVGFFQSFNGSYDASSGNLNSGSQNIQTWYARNTLGTVSPIDSPTMEAVVLDKNILNQSANDTYICLISGNQDQRAKISLGGNSSGLTTNLTILPTVSDPTENAACL